MSSFGIGGGVWPGLAHLRGAACAMVLVVAATLLAPTLARAGDDYDRWYSVEMGGRHAGSMHSLQKTEGSTITTFTQMSLEIGRGRDTVSMSMEGEFIESTDGKPISMRKVQKLATLPTVVEYTFGEKQLTVVTVEGDQKSRVMHDLPSGTWLTPAAATEYIRQRLGASAPKIVVRTIDPMSGPDPEVQTLAGIERTTVEALGKKVTAFKCTSTSSSSPGVSLTEYYDERGIPVRSQIAVGPLSLSVEPAEKEVALAKGGPAPEMMIRTFITPDRPIARARESRKAVYLLSVPKGPMPDLPQTGAQRVEPAAEHAARVTVGGSQPADEADAKNAAYLASTPMLKSDDPEVRKLVAQATRTAGDSKASRAEAMRAFVYEYITKKDLDVGFASASEVARTRSGDCTEHGTLLAGMLRADGIPARVVSGLIYAEEFEGRKGIFGYHMWAQALLERDGKPVWVDLDGTLPTTFFDATHIALATSALSEGEETSSLAAILPLMGRLEIKVESIE